MADVVSLAILGPGKVAATHATALARIPGARLVAVAGRDRDRTTAFAGQFGARAVVGLPALLEARDVDAVIVCTPHPMHRDQAVAVAEAGRHVVVEKPMALTPEDADAMIAAADEAGVVLSVISQRRWYDAARRVRDAIDDGRIGVPALATVEVLGWRGPEYYAMDAWRGTREGEGGGVLVNQAAHQLDLLSWYLGPHRDAVGFVANVNHPEIDVEDTAVAVVRFESGALASIVASNSVRPGLHASVHVHGTNGASVGVETDRGSSFVAGLSEPSIARNDLWTIPGEGDLPEVWTAGDTARLHGVDLGSHFHELQLRDIVDAIRDGRPPAVTGFDGRRTVALMAAIGPMGGPPGGD